MHTAFQARDGWRRTAIVTLIASATVFAGCCDTVAKIGVVRGKTISTRELPGTMVVVCPGEEITLGWLTKDATSATVTDLGSVSMPTGSKTISAVETKDFKLDVKGKDCDASATANVIVVKSGQSFTFSAPAVGTIRDGTLHWETNLPELFYSPKVMVTSVQLSAPPTLKGWSVRKIDLDGTIHQFGVTNIATTPTDFPIQLPGHWQLLPVDASEISASSPPGQVGLVVTLVCSN